MLTTITTLIIKVATTTPTRITLTTITSKAALNLTTTVTTTNARTTSSRNLSNLSLKKKLSFQTKKSKNKSRRLWHVCHLLASQRLQNTVVRNAIT